jgi:hypothetical protein
MISAIRTKAIRAFAVAAACASLGSVAFAGGAAEAAPARSEAATVATGAAPNCLKTSQPTSKSVRVRNTCGYTVRAKVIIAFGPDGACYTYNSGADVTWTWGGLGRFDGLQTC